MLKLPHPDAPTSLKVGDDVIYTTEVGNVFRRKIVGFCAPNGVNESRSVYLNNSSWWLPVDLKEIELAQ
jgi:hypothetical protein